MWVQSLQRIQRSLHVQVQACLCDAHHGGVCARAAPLHHAQSSADAEVQCRFAARVDACREESLPQNAREWLAPCPAPVSVGVQGVLSKVDPRRRCGLEEISGQRLGDEADQLVGLNVLQVGDCVRDRTLARKEVVRQIENEGGLLTLCGDLLDGVDRRRGATNL